MCGGRKQFLEEGDTYDIRYPKLKLAVQLFDRAESKRLDLETRQYGWFETNTTAACTWKKFSKIIAQTPNDLETCANHKFANLLRGSRLNAQCLDTNTL